MKKLIIILGFIFCSNFIFAQWTSLSIQKDAKMSANNIGNGVDGKYLSPSSGSYYYITHTQNDWLTKDTIKSGGSGQGCCSADLFLFNKDSLGVFAVSNPFGTELYKSTNSGNNWTYLSFTYPFVYNAILVSDTIAYIISNYTYSKVLRKITPSNQIDVFYSDTLRFNPCNFEFLDTSTAFISVIDTNQISYIFKTIDGCSTWSQIFTDTLNTISTIDFPDSLIGYLGTYNGKLYKTINGGITWDTLTSPTQLDIYSMDFLNDSIGYIACDSGEIYKTFDGGLTWINENSGVTTKISEIYFVDANTAYALTVDNILLKNSNILSIETYYNESNSVTIYPNPANDVITIKMLNEDKIKSLKILDNLGRTVLSGNNNTINISRLNSGVYYIIINSEKKNYNSKFIKH